MIGCRCRQSQEAMIARRRQDQQALVAEEITSRLTA
jgi:hypothetical protein